MAPALGASRLVHALLQAGAKPSSSNRNGENGEVILPLHLATKSDDAQSVRLLSRSGADLNVTGFQWVYWVSTVSAVCLYIVMSCVSTQFATSFAIQYIIAFKRMNNVNPLCGLAWSKVTDPTSGRTCVHIATSKGCLGAAIALLTARADVNFPDPLEGQGRYR